MIRPLIAAATLALLPAQAAAQTSHARPATQPAAGQLILKGTVWKCGPAGCSAGRLASRPAIACALLVRKVGRLDGFTADGRSFAAEELQKCNEKAR